MKEITMYTFYDELMKVMDGLYEKEIGNIQKAAEICAETIKNDGVVHVFGSGHSIGFGLEMQGRAGSLVPIHAIDTADFVFKGQVSLDVFKSKEVVFERTPGMADKLYDLYDIRKDDAFIIISNSGINGVVIDMAITAKERGNKVIVVTSWQHTSSEDSRHPSGKKLYELGDVVIDNCGPKGDALIETGNIEKICSISSITGAYIAQTIETEICEILVKENIELPILRVNETAKNEALLKHYEGRI